MRVEWLPQLGWTLAGLLVPLGAALGLGLLVAVPAASAGRDLPVPEEQAEAPDQ